eukprot:2127436-Amphidinium_carterae.1
MSAPYGCLATPLVAILSAAGVAVWNREVRYLTVYSQSFHAAWQSMNNEAKEKTVTEFSSLGVSLAPGAHDSWDLASRTPSLDAT